jgi:hypothetical protein
MRLCREATVTNSEVSNALPDKPTPEEKAPSGSNLKSRMRARLQLIGGVIGPH